MSEVLDNSSVKFFEEELLRETDRKLKLFEVGNLRNNELGRIRLYEERSKIKSYFKIIDEEMGLLLINNPAQGLLGKLKQSLESVGLTWKEIEGTRFDLFDSCHPDIIWSDWEENKTPPKVRLTESGKIVKSRL
jgi:hypothetical protein